MNLFAAWLRQLHRTSTHPQHLRARRDLWGCFCLFFAITTMFLFNSYLLILLSLNVSIIPIQSLSFFLFISSLLLLFFSCTYPSSTFFSTTLLLLLAPSTDSSGLVQCPLVVLCSTFPTSPSGKLQYNACRTY